MKEKSYCPLKKKAEKKGVAVGILGLKNGVDICLAKYFFTKTTSWYFLSGSLSV